MTAFLYVTLCPSLIAFKILLLGGLHVHMRKSCSTSMVVGDTPACSGDTRLLLWPPSPSQLPALGGKLVCVVEWSKLRALRAQVSNDNDVDIYGTKGLSR